MARAGRRPGTSKSRQQILDAARELFADQGVQRTSLRTIAARAGVSHAMIRHFFGTKERLFLATVDFPLDPDTIIDQVVHSGPRSAIGERLARVFVTAWRTPATARPLQALLRSATGDPTGAALVRRLLEEVALPRICAALGLPADAVAAAMAQLIGLGLLTTVLEVEPLFSASDDDLVALVAPQIQRLLTPPSPAIKEKSGSNDLQQQQ